MHLLRGVLVDPDQVVGLGGPAVRGELQEEKGEPRAVDVRGLPRGDAVVPQGRHVVGPRAPRLQSVGVALEHRAERPGAEVVEVGEVVRVRGQRRWLEVGRGLGRRRGVVGGERCPLLEARWEGREVCFSSRFGGSTSTGCGAWPPLRRAGAGKAPKRDGSCPRERRKHG